MAKNAIAVAPIRAARRVKAGWSATCTPVIAARGGSIGRMYGASLDPDAEKNTSVTAAKINRNLRGLKGGATGAASRHARRHAATSAVHQGGTPRTSSGRKNHHGSTRWCTVVRNRAKCSCTKKNAGKSGLRTETAM